MAKGVAEALMGEIAVLKAHRGHLAGSFDGARKPAPKGGETARRARLWRAGQGGHAAVLKKIHRGGTHSAKQLGAQLDYLFSKAEWCTGNIVDFDPSRRTLSPEERAEIVTTWSDGWTRDPKNGHTTHLLLSLPQHVKPKTARAIAEDWAAEMFDSGDYGDTWSYVAALHADRSHPHVHVVVQNRGVVEGTWFYMAQGHVFNLDHMKERMAAIASEHGVALETTSRVERGILSYGPGRAEIEAARREGRAVEEKVRMGAARTAALEEMKEVSGVFRDLAFLARRTEAREMAARMEAASKALDAGRVFVPHEVHAGDATSFQNRVGFRDYLRTWLKASSDRIAKLPGIEAQKVRPVYNRIAGEALTALGDARGAALAGQGARTALYQLSIRGDETRVDGKRSDLHPADARLLTITLRARAEAAGLDSDTVGARLRRGALNAHEERGWVLEDIEAMATKQGLRLSDPEARTKAAISVDQFYEEAAGIIARAYDREVEQEAKALRRTLTQMVAVEKLHGSVTFDSPDSARAFSADMVKRYGPTIMRDLAAGRTDALSADFPDAATRHAIARAVIAAAVEHEEIGLPLKEAREARERLRGSSARDRDGDKDRER